MMVGVKRYIDILLHTYLLHCITMSVNGLIAYDCADSKINLTTISLHSVKECEVQTEKVISEEIFGHLLQASDERRVHAYSCKISITRTIFHCGMHSHISAVTNGFASYIEKLGANMCRSIHTTRSYTVAQGVSVQGLRLNASNSYPITLGGKIKNDGTCDGGSFADPYGSWEDVVVQGQLQVDLSDQYTYANVRSDLVYLPSGQRCRYSDGYCMDYERGEMIWEDDDESICGNVNHVIIYQGPMQVQYTDQQQLKSIKTYSIMSDGRLISLRETGRYTQCPWTMISTEHPKLIIHVPDDQHAKVHFRRANPHDIDMMLYVNSKFVYLDRTVGKTMTEMYYELEFRRCSAERANLATLLSVAVINPVEFAYAYTGQAGYTAALMGEAIHIAQCQPVEVSLRKTGRCYQEMPVTYKNQTWFMAPRNRLLQKHATEVGCDPLLSPMYYIKDTWYSLSPDLRIARHPIVLSPNHETKWEYTSPAGLMTDGLYTMQDLEKMRMQLLHPSEKAAVENIIVQGSIGANINLQNVDITRILSDKGIEKVTDSIAVKMWGWFSTVGKISSGLVGVYVIWLCIKFILDTLIHGKLLYTLFGGSIYLVGALWASVTQYLIHMRGTKPPTEQDIGLMDKERELKEVIPQKKCIDQEVVPRGSSTVRHEIYPTLRSSAPYV